MKLFNCSECKNKREGFMHCLFYQKEPNTDICTGYQKVLKIDIMSNMQNLIRRRSVELVNIFQNIGYNYSDWSDIINRMLKQNNIDIMDSQKVARFIRSFGANGLTFACDKCDNIVELEDDSTTRCFSCGHTGFHFIST